MMIYSMISDAIGKTPLVRLQRLNPNSKNVVLIKLEGNNPAGSVKDRPAFNMIDAAEKRGEIQSNDQLVEATSGNTGIALAMVAAIKGYRMTLVMPENMSHERFVLMSDYGAEIITVSEASGMEGARDLAEKICDQKKAKLLDQFANQDNWMAHYLTTGPEIWEQTSGQVTHFVSAMGTTGTIMGVSRFLKKKNPKVKIIGVQPSEGSKIPGIRRWSKEYIPKIYDSSYVDQLVDVSQKDAENMTAVLSREEGVCAGISSGGALSVALELSIQLSDAVIVSVACDRGDRYLSQR